MNKENVTKVDPTYLKSLGEMKQTIVLPQEANLTEGQCKKIITLTASQLGVSEDNALTIIAIFLPLPLRQRGKRGHVQRVQRKFHLSIFGKEIKLSRIRKVFAECNCKNGLRKFARAYGTEIYEIAKAVGVPGNLYKKKIRRSDRR